MTSRPVTASPVCPSSPPIPTTVPSDLADNRLASPLVPPGISAGAPLHDDPAVAAAIREAVRANEAQTRAIIETAPNIIVGIRPDGTIFEWNEAAEQHYGVPREEALGGNYVERFVPLDGRAAARATLHGVLAGTPLRGVERTERRPSGEVRQIRWNMSRIADAGAHQFGIIAVGDDITDAHAAQERFRVLFERSSDPHLLFDDRGIVDCNEATVRILRAESREALIGLHPADFSPPAQPDGANSVIKGRQMVDMAHATGHHRFDWLHRRLDGTHVFVEVSLTSITLQGRPTLVVVWRDLTVRAEAEEAIRRERARLVDAIELLDSSFAMFDEEDRLLVCNQSFVADRPQWRDLARSGVALADLLRATLVDGKVPETGEDGEAWVADSLARHHSSGDTHVQQVGDRTLRITVQPTSDGGSVSLATDISPLVAVQRSLEEARDAAERANRAKSDFLARMSHELRTPLNAIIGFTRIIDRSRQVALPDREREYLKRVEANGLRLLAVVNDILDLAKIEAGRLDIHRSATDIGALVTETVAQCEGYPRRPGVVLRADVPTGVRPLVTDGARLRQVLVNLISNALKFTESGEVVVRLRTNDTGRPVVVEVQDTGLGIPAHRMEAIFESFEQADTTTGRDYGGTGLGLSISRALCLALGAKLSVESAVGRGSTFRVVLPAM